MTTLKEKYLSNKITGRSLRSGIYHAYNDYLKQNYNYRIISYTKYCLLKKYIRKIYDQINPADYEDDLHNPCCNYIWDLIKNFDKTIKDFINDLIYNNIVMSFSELQNYIQTFKEVVDNHKYIVHHNNYYLFDKNFLVTKIA